MPSRGASAREKFNVGCAVSISPGYNIAEAFAVMDRDQPFYARQIVAGIQRVFLQYTEGLVYLGVA